MVPRRFRKDIICPTRAFKLVISASEILEIQYCTRSTYVIKRNFWMMRHDNVKITTNNKMKKCLLSNVAFEKAHTLF